MSAGDITFNRRAVRPVQCVREGWQLIKDDYWLFLGITLLGALIAGAVPLGILMGPAYCGIYLCLLRRERGLPVTFDMLFKGFNYFVPSLIATLIMVVPIFILVVVMYVLMVVAMFAVLGAAGSGPGSNKPPDGATVLAFVAVQGVIGVVFTLLAMLISALFLFAYELIVDRGLSGVEAVRVSARAALANLGGLFGLLLLTFVMTAAGVLACYVGAFFVLPLTFAMTVIAYRQVFPFEEAAAKFLPEGIEPFEPESTGIQTARPPRRPAGPGGESEGIRGA